MSDDATINVEKNQDDREFTRSGFELLICNPEGHSSRFPICFGEVTLGGPGERQVDIQLDSPELSNRQIAFHYRQGELFFTNLKSSLAVTLNNTVATFSPLKDGDELAFLGYSCRVFHLDQKLAILEGCTEPYRGQLWGIDGEEPVTIGRGQGQRPNLVDLNDRTVSRSQATITHQQGSFFLHPDTLNSPTRVNGTSVSERVPLNNGALIQLGQQLVRFRINGAEKQRRDMLPQEATILFSDVWNYSSFAEGRPLEETIQQMNEFYSGLGKVIKAHGGVLLTFLGDAMMAVFGADGPEAEDPERAVRAALAMQTRLEELNEVWRSQNKPTLNVGVGINSGEVMVGDVGFTGKFEFAAMGDNTNLAARVEKLTRELGSRIIVTGSTRAALGDEFLLRDLGTTKVKGRETPVHLFGVDGVLQ